MTNVSIRLDDDDLKKLRQVAEHEKESLSGSLRRMIRRRFKGIFAPANTTQKIVKGFLNKVLKE